MDATEAESIARRLLENRFQGVQVFIKGSRKRGQTWVVKANVGAGENPKIVRIKDRTKRITSDA